MINAKEELHQKFVSHIKSMVSSLSKGKDGDAGISAAYETVMTTGKEVLKQEWNVVKET